MKTHWKQNFDYRFTGAYELEPGQEVVLTISKLGHEKLKNQHGQEETCFVAYFDGKHKPMVLNKTNCKSIEKLYGAYQEDWVGKQITVYAAKVSAFGEQVDALRIRERKPVATKQATPEQLEQISALLEMKSITDEEREQLGEWKQYDTNQAKRCIEWLSAK